MKLDINAFGYLVILFIIGFTLKIYFESEMFHLKCIVSDEDGHTYCVRETPKLELVADLLARTTRKLEELVVYMKDKYPQRENVQRMAKRFNPRKISETLPTSQYTAYSENKGEKLAFCTTTKKDGNKLIDENTLAFVAIHELGHVMTESVGHTKEFWQNFKFLLKDAVKLGIYKPVDYKKNPKSYCGMNISDNPYYDL
jgi:hypothetical protein|tara:strand:- start:1455 stop:2051 length:597 start_codon:yes stop_codon:yes gene_type:complete